MNKLLLLVLTTAGLLGIAPGSHGQAPILSRGSSFALFTADGAFTSTGATAVTGNIGTNTSMILGFPPGTFTGTSHEIDSISGGAAKDIDDAYGAAADFTEGTELGVTLGSDQVLTPDTYLVGDGVTLTGNLDLDGQGSRDALFIIKIDGPLTVEAASAVRLINGSIWENVYWIVRGPVEIGADAAFKGTILTSGNIRMLLNAALQGRALSRLGSITLNNTVVSNALTPAPLPEPLPVQLTSFTTESRHENALLRWTTATEKQNAYFAVQRSTDGKLFSSIGRVNGHATTGVAQAYTWTDANLAGHSAEVIYYRLKQVDLDSSSQYSPVRTLKRATKAGLQVQAYPSSSQLPCRLQIDAQQAGPATIRLTNVLGHVLNERQTMLVPGHNTFPLEAANALSSGVYLLQVTQGNSRQTVRLIRE